jgi:hypothetical protein
LNDVRQVLHWREDTDLLAIRDAVALAKLAGAERKEWQAFWSDLEALLKRAAVRAP